MVGRTPCPTIFMLEFLLALGVIHSLAIAPRPLAEPLARLYTRFLDLAIPRLRRVGMRNLELALPELSLEKRVGVIDGVFRSIARVLVSFARFPRLTKDNIHHYIRYEGYQHFESALKQGKGVLFATAHLGNWELSAFAHALMSAPMHVVVRPLDNPRVDALVETRRAASGNRIIGKKEFARSILRALKDNEAVGVLVDQNSGLEDGVFVDFFGIPACAGASFARIAAHSGAAVIPGFALWSEDERKHILRFYPPIEITEDTVRDTQTLHSQLEQVIRQYPDQWLWIHRRWKTRPPGASALY
jgi:Kdo2-lipid IVA lauroyltransferase/acyltransferase